MECIICKKKLIEGKGGCKDSPDIHSHFDVRWGDVKCYGGWVNITVCGGHTASEITEWLEKRIKQTQ